MLHTQVHGLACEKKGRHQLLKLMANLPCKRHYGCYNTSGKIQQDSGRCFSKTSRRQVKSCAGKQRCRISSTTEPSPLGPTRFCRPQAVLNSVFRRTVALLLPCFLLAWQCPQLLQNICKGEGGVTKSPVHFRESNIHSAGHQLTLCGSLHGFLESFCLQPSNPTITIQS